MKILTRLRKKAPEAEAKLRAELLAVLTTTPEPWPIISCRVDMTPIPDEVTAGDVIRALLGKLCDEGLAVEAFDGMLPMYSLAPTFADVSFKKEGMLA